MTMNPLKLTPEQQEAAALKGVQIAHQCKPLLTGQDPADIGVALAELTSLWIGGHHPELREIVFKRWLELTEALIEHNAMPLAAFDPKRKH